MKNINLLLIVLFISLTSCVGGFQVTTDPLRYPMDYYYYYDYNLYGYPYYYQRHYLFDIRPRHWQYTPPQRRQSPYVNPPRTLRPNNEGRTQNFGGKRSRRGN